MQIVQAAYTHESFSPDRHELDPYTASCLSCDQKKYTLPISLPHLSMLIFQYIQLLLTLPEFIELFIRLGMHKLAH